MPAILLARRLAWGEGIGIGAHAAMGLLTLAEFEPEFERWVMVTEWNEEGAAAEGLRPAAP